MLAVVLMMCFGAFVAADVDALIKKADVEYQAQRWEAAAELYGKVVQQDPKRSRAWFRLGIARHSLGELDAAIVAHGKAAEFPALARVALYNLGCAHALRGDTDAAVAALERAVRAGFANSRLIVHDPDLFDLHPDARFQVILGKLNVSSPPQRQFDFWVGEWEVFNPHGVKVGSNVITREQNGRVIMERWTSSNGGGGQSMNYVDPETGSWKQLWIDAGGGRTEYEGKFEDGAMRFTSGERVEPDGTVKLTRSTFTPLPDGRVRQFIEHSTDKGRAWKTYFDGTYVRKQTTDPEASGSSL